MEVEMEENVNDYSDQSKLLLHHHPQTPRKLGGFRTLPLIIVNESLEKVASYGLMPNMIFYLIRDYHLEIATGSIILALWAATSNSLGIFGAFISDSYLGRYRVVVIGSLSSFLGMLLMWLTATIPDLKPPPCEQSSNNCIPPTASQILVLLSAFGLISIGAGCVRPCSMAFGADQLEDKDNPNNESLQQSFLNWYYASSGVSAVIALTVVVYIQDHWGWRVGFGIPVILMAISTLVFLWGSSMYVKVKAGGQSLFTGFAQVLVVAFKRRKLSAYPGDYEDSHHRNVEMKPITSSDDLRWLDKAIITKDPERDLNPDGSPLNPWDLSTADQVNSLKSFLRVIPIWSTGIGFSITTNQLSFSALQAYTLNRHITSNFEIPAASFIVFMIVTLMLCVAFYDRVMVPILSRHTGHPRGLSPKFRMGLGLVAASLATTVAAVVESLRRKEAIREGNPEGILNMSAMWLVPQYIVLGVAEGFYATGQIEFFYSQLPKSMSSIAMALFSLGMAAASLVGGVLLKTVDAVTSRGGGVSWLSSDLSKGHIDYYYWLSTFLGLLNFVYFLFCCKTWKSCKDSKSRFSDRLVDGESD